jgi:monothiol glutaredoxin
LWIEVLIGINGAWLMSSHTGIKEYSEWPTIPQLYVDKEFVGGCDILMSMHQDGSLAKMLEEKKVLVAPAEESK